MATNIEPSEFIPGPNFAVVKEVSKEELAAEYAREVTYERDDYSQS